MVRLPRRPKHRPPADRPPAGTAPGRASVLSRRSVAGQVFVLQVVIVLLLVAAGVVAQVLLVRHNSEQEARSRSLAVASTFAAAPGIQAALRSPDPTAILQPRAEQARKQARVDFIVVMNTKGIRYTHPNPARIGDTFVGTIAPAVAGGTVIEQVNGTLGPLVQAVVPVKAPDGRVVGLVSSGITTAHVGGAANRELPLLMSTGAVALVLATGGTALISRRLLRQTRGLGPNEMTRMYEHHDAVLHAVREGVMIVGGDGQLLLANDEARRLLDLPDHAERRHVLDLGLDPRTAELLASGRSVTDEVRRVGNRLIAVNQRPTDTQGGPPGSVATLRDSTELRALSGRAEQARARLNLLYDAGVSVGTSLDIRRTAEELAEVAVPRLADIASVDLYDAVLQGEEPEGPWAGPLRRAALSGNTENLPFYPVGDRIATVPSSPLSQALESGRGVLDARIDRDQGWAQKQVRAVKLVERGVHSLLTVPVRAGTGTVLGLVNFWRGPGSEPYDTEDLVLAEELVTRAAVSIDNARRFTHEHSMAVTLQRSLLPRSLPEQSALEIAYRYLPAQSGVGGDWFDVVPLSGTRVALVVGDVVGHGLHAAGTMGRLRTAVSNFSALDLPPDELMGLLDELVARIDREDRVEGDSLLVTGATCLYAVYDPVSRLCTVARAGHPPPAVVLPDGRVEFPDIPVGPPLGLGGLPWPTADVELPEGSRLVLYTDGLIESRDRDIDEGLEMLRTSLEQAGPSPEETCREVLDTRLASRPRHDDIALIVARSRAVPEDRIVRWEVPTDPAAVGEVRAKVTRQLAVWGLEELSFTTELILSELVTNALRYGVGPIRVRILLDRALICEVFDGGGTSPHVRRAAALDEGGRGLFLVAQVAERWGTRYTADGKIIWAAQRVPPHHTVPGGEK